MNSKYQLIGISGTNGSGKDTVADIIVKTFNFKFISVSQLLRDEAIKRTLSADRSNTRLISSEWREKYGPSVLVDRAIAEFDQLKSNFNGLIISSIRNSGEVEKIHQLKGIVIWIDANPRFRFDRIQSNLKTRSRPEDDKISFEKFLDDERTEMYLSATNTTLDMNNVKQQADFNIINESSIDQLKSELLQILN